MPKEERFSTPRAELVELLPEVKSLIHRADDASVCDELRMIMMHATLLIKALEMDERGAAHILKTKALSFFDTVETGLSSYENEPNKDPVFLVEMIARVYASIESFTLSI
ncbi:hypothetical protein [Xanthocytophaga agilis]|uniref:Uncharacterized protein n=1 Tax=Xanthocytophaga agilis TaxID=3048010 RepID=A0AAE3R6B2_9BACT|nr:hypothetical protein [Xanthocytophaga agilis]MDJ1501578.1 hypothetical protein [Xanthocytophaga agilis]